MTDTIAAPKVFVSYSWSGPDHEHAVMELAKGLEHNGIHVILDKWDLKPGHDKFAFMEKMVIDPTVSKVLVICDRKYQEKANNRKGGVGTESQIMSAELYAKVDQVKFIPVVFERDETNEPCLPVFMKSLMYVDMSAEDRYGEGLEDILRQIYGKPLHERPGRGSPPAFLQANEGRPIAKELKSALNAIQVGKQNRQGLEHQFITAVVAQVKGLYVQPEGRPGYDEEIYQAILRTKGLRDQISEYCDCVSLFSDDDRTKLASFIAMMEFLGQEFGPPIQDGSFVDGWADIYKFFGLEAILLMTAALIRHSRWKSLRHLLKYPYIVRTDHSGRRVAGVEIFDSYIVSMDEHRNSRLSMRQACLTAAMLRERSSSEHTSFAEMVQADVFLALHGVVHLKERSEADGSRGEFWGPRTTILRSDSQLLPVFMKAVDPEIRDGLRTALGVASAGDLATRVQAARPLLDDFKALSMGRYPSFNFVEATNLQMLVK